jgi:hypothetical protein
MFSRRSAWRAVLAAGFVGVLVLPLPRETTRAEKAEEPAVEKATANDEVKAEKAEAKKSASVAHIKLSGSLDEKAPSSDPLFGSAAGENFKARLDRIHKFFSLF